MGVRPSRRPIWARCPLNPGLAVAFALVAFLTSGDRAARADTEVGSWSRTGSLLEEGPLPVNGLYPGSSVTLADGRVLEFPGEHRDSEIYDPALGTWAQGPLPLQEVEGKWTLVALSDGGALLLGATPCERPDPKAEERCLPSATVYRWSPGENEWRLAAPMREARVHPVAVLLPDGRVLVAGGFGNHECPRSEVDNETYACQPLASAELYDPTSEGWIPTTPMPQARGGATGVLLSDGTVLVVGGEEARNAIRYEPDSENWTAAGQTTVSRSGSTLFALPDDRALTLGSRPRARFYGSPSITEPWEARKMREEEGVDPCHSGVSSEVFDPTTNAWTPTPTEPAGSEEEGCPQFQAVLLAGGRILLRNEAEPSYYELDDEQRCWSTTSPPLEAHNRGEMVALSDGRALIFGGYEDYHWLSSAEVYVPSTSECAVPPHAVPPPTTPSAPAPRSSPPSRSFTGVTINLHKRLSVTRRGLVRVSMLCPASATEPCTGQVEMDLRAAASPRARARSGGRKDLYLGGSRFTIGDGMTRWVTIHVKRHMRALRDAFRQLRHTTVVLEATDRDDNGQVITSTASVTLHD